MSSISDLVSHQIAQTEAYLQSEDGLSNYAAIKSSMIARAKSELYLTASIPSESDMPDLVKFYLSDVAVCHLIETAIDWFQNKTILRQVQGDDTLEFYDRVAGLRAKKRDLYARIEKAVGQVKALIFSSGEDIADLAGLPLAQAQSEGRTNVTVDPWQFARYLYGDLVVVSEGFDPRIISVDRPGG